MKKPIIKKLKYPLWLNIVFYIFTVVAPIILTMVQGFRSTSQIFRITFGVISSVIIIWSFLRKFIIVNKEKTLSDEKVKLEHEYKTGIGDADKVEYLWLTNEIWLTLIILVDILLRGLFVFIIAEGIAKGLMKIEGLMIFIVITYAIAFAIKFIYITSTRNKKYKEEEVETNGEQPKE